MRHVLSAALLAMLCACENVPMPGNPRANIDVIGDSNSLLAMPHLIQALSDFVVPVAPMNGYALVSNTPFFVEQLTAAQMVQAPARGVAIILGTNNLAYDDRYALIDTPDKLDSAIDALIAACPPQARVVWVAPNAPALDLGRRLVFAYGLARAAQRWPQLRAFPADESWYLPADTHFSPSGAAAMAKRVRELLDAEAQKP